jgi:hypothetical protein
MTTHAVSRTSLGRKVRNLPVAQFALLIGLVFAATAFVSYVLWPTWPAASVALDAPSIPITVAGVLFDIPPAAIRAAVQRHPGPHERIDLAFESPALRPPKHDIAQAGKPNGNLDDDAELELAQVNDRLFVTIAGLGALLPPAERLRTIYPRYLEAQATAGPQGLAISPFRAGTPYEGEDLVYDAAKPEKFFARCTRQARTMPGTCVYERTLDGADITFRFPRNWLGDWQNIAGGFERLLAQLHPEAVDGQQRTDDR